MCNYDLKRFPTNERASEARKWWSETLGTGSDDSYKPSVGSWGSHGAGGSLDSYVGPQGGPEGRFCAGAGRLRTRRSGRRVLFGLRHGECGCVPAAVRLGREVAGYG